MMALSEIEEALSRLNNADSQQMLHEVLAIELKIFREAPNEVLKFLSSGDISSGIADLTWMVIDSFCANIDYREHQDFLLFVVSKTINTLSSIANKSGLFLAHESTKGTAWQAIMQRFADEFGDEWKVDEIELKAVKNPRKILDQHNSLI